MMAAVTTDTRITTYNNPARAATIITFNCNKWYRIIVARLNQLHRGHGLVEP
jgi:hypothetical protein